MFLTPLWFFFHITVLEGDDTLLQSAVNHHYKSLETADGKVNRSSTDDSTPVIDFCMCNPPFFDTGE